MKARLTRKRKVQAFLDSIMTADVTKALLEEWTASYTETLLFGHDPHYDARIQRLATLALRPTPARPSDE